MFLLGTTCKDQNQTLDITTRMTSHHALKPANATKAAPQQVLDAAATCFMEKGYAGTSLDDVARHMGATKGRIYHYFSSKSELLHAVRKRAMEINFAAITPAYDSALDPIEKFRAMARAHALNMMREQAYQQALFDRLNLHITGGKHADHDVWREEFMSERRAFEDMFRAVLAQGQASGAFKIRTLSYALHAVITMLNSTISWYRPRADEPENTQAKIANELVDMTLGALGVNT